LASENSNLPGLRKSSHRQATGGPWPRGANRVEFTAVERAPELIQFGDRLREIGIDRIELLNDREMVSFCTTSAPSLTSAAPTTPSIGRGPLHSRD